MNLRLKFRPTLKFTSRFTLVAMGRETHTVSLSSSKHENERTAVLEGLCRGNVCLRWWSA